MKEIFLNSLTPLIILVVVIVILIIFLRNQNRNIVNEIKGAFIGTLIGVLIGFVTQNISDQIKEHRSMEQNKSVYLDLLKQDAIKAYQNVWMYEKLINSPNVPPQFKEHATHNIPMEFDIRYWNLFSRYASFLMLGREKPFDKIFEIMFELERINDFGRKAEAGDISSGKFARVLYDETIVKEKRTHTLLKIFLSDKEIDELKNSWLNLNSLVATKPAQNSK